MKNQNSSYNTANYRLTGVAPLILHNGQTCDPLNKFTKMLKEATSKRKKTDADHLEVSRIEFHAGLYVGPNNNIIMPAANLTSCIAKGAQKSKLGKDFKSSVFVFENSPIKFKDMEKSPTELWDMGEEYVLRSKVKVGTSSVIRTRPIFRDWSLDLQVSFNPEVVNESSITKALKDAGMLIGLGDWVPQNGRFMVEKI